MATKIADRSVEGTLTPGVVDTVQLGVQSDTMQVFNRSLTDPMYVRMDGVDPVAGADGSHYVGPGSVRLFPVVDPIFPEMRIITAGLTVSYNAERFP